MTTMVVVAAMAVMMAMRMPALEPEVDAWAVAVPISVDIRAAMTDPVTMPPMAVTPGPIVNEIDAWRSELFHALAWGRAQWRCVGLQA